MKLKTINITNRKFSLEALENYLRFCLPGRYHINWKHGENIYEMKLKWDGKEFTDLHQEK
jgi:hypothetical protein